MHYLIEDHGSGAPTLKPTVTTQSRWALDTETQTLNHDIPVCASIGRVSHSLSCGLPTWTAPCAFLANPAPDLPEECEDAEQFKYREQGRHVVDDAHEHRILIASQSTGMDRPNRHSGVVMVQKHVARSCRVEKDELVLDVIEYSEAG